ncbi:hypothetical protein FEI17_27165 (plasmid) [Kosakonia radicincitans]|uniref:hypothetical protein n=1 Tax=Kosakonia radicincitans TaxID=283686 RepID=UPI0011EF737C|nr:hypothetical protein [Kosakonia radicincitans]QEM94312.1 hypothetical protein FEI17_27165 [Kosakonia radicincitans]
MNVYEFPLTNAWPCTFNIMLGMATLLMLVGLVLEIKKKSEGSKKPEAEWRYGMPVDERPGGKQTDMTTAMYLWQQSGINCTLRMLKSLEAALNEAGYGLARSTVPACYTISPEEMLPHLRRQVVCALLRAREKFWAPAQSETGTEDLVRLAMSSGFGDRMLDDLLENLRNLGWVLQKIRSDRELYAYPLQQVVVKITGRYDACRDDMLQCLQEAVIHALTGEENTLPENHGTFRGKGSNIRYEITRQERRSPPGFFPEHTPEKLPSALTDEMHRFNASLRNHIVVLLQCTRNCTPDMLPSLTERVARQLTEGRNEGVMDDDDTGYAFACQGRCFD